MFLIQTAKAFFSMHNFDDIANILILLQNTKNTLAPHLHLLGINIYNQRPNNWKTQNEWRQSNNKNFMRSK